MWLRAIVRRARARAQLDTSSHPLPLHKHAHAPTGQARDRFETEPGFRSNPAAELRPPGAGGPSGRGWWLDFGCVSVRRGRRCGCDGCGLTVRVTAGSCGILLLWALFVCLQGSVGSEHLWASRILRLLTHIPTIIITIITARPAAGRFTPTLLFLLFLLLLSAPSPPSPGKHKK